MAGGRERAARAAAVWVLLVSIAVGAVVRAQEAAPVDEIRVVGSSRVEEESIRVHLRAQVGLPYDAKTVDEDIRALYRMGFFSNVIAELNHESGRRVLVYAVTERPLVREVTVEGERAIGRAELEPAFKVRPHTILDPEKVRRGIEEAKKLYEKKGYLDATITYDTPSVGENEVTLAYRVDEGKRVRIAKLVFEGARQVSPGTLRGVMQTRQKWFLSRLTGAGNLDREVLKTDIERITAYYYDHGYIDVRIDEPLIERKQDGLYVTIKIDEGEIYSVGGVDIAGDLLSSNAALLEGLKMKPNETFRASRIREDISSLTEAYGDEGYAFVNVTPDTAVNPTLQTVDVRYRVGKGPEVSFDRIEISGNTKTRDKVIRRELRVQEQQRFSGSGLRRSQERIRRLGFFQDVNLTTRRAEDEDHLNLLVDVKEGPTGSFAAGAGISSGESFLFNVRLSEINFLGRGQRVSLNADFGSIRQNFSLSFTEPYLFDSELSLGVEAFNWRLEFDEFTRGGTGGAIRFFYPLTALGYPTLFGYSLEDTRLGLEYRVEEAEITDVSPTAATVIRAEEGSQLTSSVTPRLFRDTRNHPFDPTAGSLQDLSFELAGLGGSSRFYKAEARGRWYFPFYRSERWGTFVVGQGLTFGLGHSYGGNNSELPLFERYFPGGMNSVRGYDVRTLGPRVAVFDARGRLVRLDAVGGSQQFVSNTEIIFPIVESLGLRGVLFFDAGEAFTSARGLDFGGLRLAYGAGIRWLSPIGPLRIEVGFPVERRVDDSAQSVDFSFGGPP